MAACGSGYLLSQAGRFGALQKQVQRLEEAVKDLKPQLGRTEALA